MGLHHAYLLEVAMICMGLHHAYLLEVGMMQMPTNHEPLSTICHVEIHADFSSMITSLDPYTFAF
jgi:hypothetical protein